MDRRSFLAASFAAAAFTPRPWARLKPSTFDPTAYGAVASVLTGDDARNLEVAQRNRTAFQRCADAFRDAVKAGDRGAVFVFPRGEYPICTASYAGANYINPAKLPGGWSRHAVVFDAGVATGLRIEGGHMAGEGCRIVRIENDPLATGTGADAGDSTILVMGRWGGLCFTGDLELEGYQVDTLAKNRRGATSGDGWQFSFGVHDFTAEHIKGNKGSNAAFAINYNKRRIVAGGAGRTGYEMRDEWLCRRFEIARVTAINGEHGGLVNGADDIHIGRMDVTQADYTYRGRAQARYQQRGLYLLNANRFTCGTLNLSGIHRAALYMLIHGTNRAAHDLDVSIDTVRIEAPRGQWRDPDGYAGVQIQNAIEAGSGMRAARIRIGRLTTRGVRSGLVWRDRAADDRLLVAEDRAVLDALEIGSADIQATGQGVSIKPLGGAGRIVLGTGRVSVARDAAYADAEPVSGVSIEAISRTRKARAAGEGRSLAEHRAAFARRPPKPGEVSHVSDWPGGAQCVIFDPSAPEAVEGWRPMREAAPVGECVIGLEQVSSERAPARFAGIDRLVVAGTAFARTGAGGAHGEPVVAIEDSPHEEARFTESGGH